jgi:thiol:disulfide interchange protein DsbD
MSKKLHFLLPLLFVFTTFHPLNGIAQLDQPVKWNHRIEKVNNETLKIILTASVEPRWHLYSMDSPEEGSLPLLINIEPNSTLAAIGSFVQITTPKEEYDDIFEVNVKFFEKQAIFEQKFKPLTKTPFSSTIIIEGQACFEDGKCVMVSDEIVVSIDPSKFFTTIDPTNNNSSDNSHTQSNETLVVDTSPNSSDTITENTEIENNEVSNETQNTQETDATPSTNAKDDNKSLLGTFLLAIVLGLAGVLTPCVFPMIPMTVSFFMQGKSSRASSIFKALIFGISIVILYTLVGVIVSLTSAGADFPTLLSTHWIPNSVFFLLFIFFAGSFFGLYEIVLPGGLANKADKQVDKGGVLSAFFMAVTLVIVSFACTGPIVGALLVKAASGSIIEPTIGMLGFGIGFGLPFTVLAISPGWLNKLPQSGGWMNSVKVVMAFIILAFSLKFLSNMDQNYHLNIMSRDLYLAIWIVLFFMLGIYLLGKIRLPHDTELKHVSVFRLVLAMIAFIFAVYMVPGLFGADLKPISGLIPPKSLQQFTISGGGTHSAGSKNTLCEEPKYADVLHLEEGVVGYFDFEQGMRCAKEQNKPALVYFTGHSCSNCKKMMADVWTDKVKNYFNNEFIFIVLYVDDKYKIPENEWVTSEIDGKVKKTIGQKNSDIQISKFNINSQPYYIILSPDGTPKNEAMEFETNENVFVEWLDKGLQK